MKNRCKGCRRIDCRWKGAGSLCYYNDHGEAMSACSYCANSLSGDRLVTFKTFRFDCKGYQRKVVVNND